MSTLSNTDLTKDGAMSAIVGKVIVAVLDAVITKISNSLEKIVEAKLNKWLGNEVEHIEEKQVDISGDLVDIGDGNNI